MASIVKRKSKYSVVYNYTDENGIKRQKWETYSSNAEAKKRKVEIEYEQNTGSFVAPSVKTLHELLDEYVSIYGISTWALSTYEGHKGLIDNYINPIIGDLKLEAITPRVMDQYYKNLLKVKAKPRPYHPANGECLTPRTVREIHKLLRNAFNQAVKWELMSRNPVAHATLPQCEAKPREIWTADTLFHALELCTDDTLALAINLAFACSLRMGEMLALTWDCIDISRVSIDNGTASLYVNKELQRVQRESLNALDGKGVIKTFPAVLQSRHTALVLKEPKTKTSVRKIFIPKTVAEMLVARKEEQENLKELFGDEYTDYGLVFCSSFGHPIEGQIINRALNKLIAENDLPKVVFHSLRHSSITYKLKLNGGDMKSVQGDSGHAQLKMVADVYSHIIDDDRKINAQHFEETFYSGRQKKQPEKKPDVPQPKELPEKAPEKADEQLLLRLLEKPEMATILKALANTI